MASEKDIDSSESIKCRKISAKSSSSDSLLYFLNEIKGLSKMMKKRVHKVLNTEGMINPRGIKALILKQFEEFQDINKSTSSLLLQQFETKKEGSMFMSLEEREETEIGLERILTSSKNLDDLLRGGVPTGTFLELYSAPKSGKTQHSYTMSTNCLLPQDFEGLDAGGVWLTQNESHFNLGHFGVCFVKEEAKHTELAFENDFDLKSPVKEKEQESQTEFAIME